MSARIIAQANDEILRKVSKKVCVYDVGLWRLLDDMRATLRHHEGMGLAAVQVRVLRRVVVMQINNIYLEMINPEIVWQSEEEVVDAEACLSIDGHRGMVSRPKELTVKFFDRFGYEYSMTGKGMFARCVCHELDHLDGILYTDKQVREVKPDPVISRKPKHAVKLKRRGKPYYHEDSI